MTTARTEYTKIKDVASNAVSVNVIAGIEKGSFRPYSDKSDQDLGEVVIGDASACIVLVITREHANTLESSASVFSIKNVLPAVVHGRMQLELNMFSEISPVKAVAHFSINKSTDMSTIVVDPYSSSNH